MRKIIIVLIGIVCLLSGSVFAVFVEEPSLNLLTPNGGEIWESGETHRITWNSVGLESIWLYIVDPSIFGSGSTNYITPGASIPIPAEQGYYDWTIPRFGHLPGLKTDNFQISVMGDESGVQEISDNPFTILPNPPISVMAPDDEEVMQIGDVYRIIWDGSSFYTTSSIQIGLRDTRYSPVFARGEATIANTSNTGGYDWTIPSNIDIMELGVGDVYQIAIYVDQGGPGLFALSDGTFSIIPEPVTICLLGLGAISLMRRRIKR